MTWQQWDSPDDMPDKPPPPPLNELVAALTSRRGWQSRLHGARVHALWSQIAGDELARHVEPVRLAGGVLVVRAESPAWATQVRYLSAELLERANAVLGEGEVQSVKVQAGQPEPRRRR